MGNKAWKEFERYCAKLINGFRYAANQGGPIDVESLIIAAQCKLRKAMGLKQLHDLAVKIQEDAKGKLGLLFVKPRFGSGTKSETLVIMTEKVWRKIFGYLPCDGLHSLSVSRPTSDEAGDGLHGKSEPDRGDSRG